MQDKLIFLIGSPRSGSTLLMRMLASHSQVLGRPEPHLLTPLAHLGYYDRVDQAPYDQLQAASATREFVQDLPGGEEDYLDALRAYCEVLYGRMLATQDKPYFLDKTPANALILPFLAKVFPRAHFVVLTRHPCSIWDSYAESFFDGDYAAARAFNPILDRYVPAIASFLRENSVSTVHVRYEDIVAEPEEQLKRIYTHIGIAHEPETVNYGARGPAVEGGLGDPIGVAQHSAPVTTSVAKWAQNAVAHSDKERMLRAMVEGLASQDLEVWGYEKSTLFDAMASVDVVEARAQAVARGKQNRFTRYKMQRRLLVRLRKNIHQNALGRLVTKVRFFCDVLLRGGGQTGWADEAGRPYGDPPPADPNA